jgi:hypothetical protein
VLRDVDALPGRHVFFLDDHLFGDRKFAEALLDGLRGMGRVWQAARTVDWAVRVGNETTTFHILTPYPGTALYRRMEAEGRLLHRHWDLYDTRHAVYRPARMSPAELERGYWQAYRDFYGCRAILRAAATKPTLSGMMRHLAYSGGWKKLDKLWGWVIRSRMVCCAVPLLESVLAPRCRQAPRRAAAPCSVGGSPLPPLAS